MDYTATSMTRRDVPEIAGSIPLALLAMAQTLRISVTTVSDAVLGRLTRDRCDRRLRDWASRLVREADMNLHVHGEEHAVGDRGRGEPFVLMSNHQSHYDVPVLFRVFPGTLRMVAKSELYRIPIFGPGLRAAEFVEVDRSDKEKARQSIAVAKQRIESGIHVWIAPEGTRSETGALGPFKKGGFILALDTKTRILPITIEGTRHVLRPHTGRVRRGHRVDVTFHPPIDPVPYGFERRDELVSRVRATIASALPESLRG